MRYVLQDRRNLAIRHAHEKTPDGQSWREITVEIGVHPSVIGFEIIDPRPPPIGLDIAE